MRADYRSCFFKVDLDLLPSDMNSHMSVLGVESLEQEERLIMEDADAKPQYREAKVLCGEGESILWKTKSCFFEIKCDSLRDVTATQIMGLSEQFPTLQKVGTLPSISTRIFRDPERVLSPLTTDTVVHLDTDSRLSMLPSVCL
jgi:hypothetical protein